MKSKDKCRLNLSLIFPLKKYNTDFIVLLDRDRGGHRGNYGNFTSSDDGNGPSRDWNPRSGGMGMPNRTNSTFNSGGRRGNVNDEIPNSAPGNCMFYDRFHNVWLPILVS